MNDQYWFIFVQNGNLFFFKSKRLIINVERFYNNVIIN